MWIAALASINFEGRDYLLQVNWVNVGNGYCVVSIRSETEGVRSGMIPEGSYTGLARAVGAAIKLSVGLDIMPYDFAAAMITDRRELVNCTFKAVKSMSIARCDDFKG